MNHNEQKLVDNKQNYREALETEMQVFLYDYIINNIAFDEEYLLYFKSSVLAREYITDELKVRGMSNNRMNRTMLFIEFCFESTMPSRISNLVDAIYTISPNTFKIFRDKFEKLKKQEWRKK